MNFETLLENFNNTIDLPLFFLNMLVATILSLILRSYYIFFGQSIANRHKFSSNFMPLALTTFLVITIIKSSITLSLGLVGALSIVRFRAAIKEPEELIYLFMVVAIGLATGANYPILASVAVITILLLLLINHYLGKKKIYTRENMLYVNIHSAAIDINPFVNILEEKMQFVELKRLDRSAKGIDATFICKALNLDAITSAQDLLVNAAPETSVSIVDQPDLIM
jgi:uncharacterized membrane protein YhiD involved in acid resistance